MAAKETSERDCFANFFSGLSINSSPFKNTGHYEGVEGLRDKFKPGLLKKTYQACVQPFLKTKAKITRQCDVWLQIICFSSLELLHISGKHSLPNLWVLCALEHTISLLSQKFQAVFLFFLRTELSSTKNSVHEKKLADQPQERWVFFVRNAPLHFRGNNCIFSALRKIWFFRQSNWFRQGFQGHLKVLIALKFCLVPWKLIFSQSQARSNLLYDGSTLDLNLDH